MSIMIMNVHGRKWHRAMFTYPITKLSSHISSSCEHQWHIPIVLYINWMHTKKLTIHTSIKASVYNWGVRTATAEALQQAKCFFSIISFKLHKLFLEGSDSLWENIRLYDIPRSRQLRGNWFNQEWTLASTHVWLVLRVQFWPWVVGYSLCTTTATFKELDTLFNGWIWAELSRWHI